MKNKNRILSALLSLLLLVMLMPLQAFAAGGNPELNDLELAKSITIKQSEPGLALTDSVAMLLRRAAIREGADKSVWSGFTESYVRKTNGGAALPGSRIYTLNGRSYTVKACKADGMSENDWIELLAAHPEGVVLRFRNAGGEEEQGVLMTHYLNSAFFCLDPDPSTESGLVDVRGSGFGKSAEIGKSQEKLFAAVTYYYAVSSGISDHTHVYGTEGDSLGVCKTCGFVYYLENQRELSGRATPAEGLTGFSLKKKPYTASEYIKENGQNLRFTAVTVLGIAKNHYGNVWYKVESLDKKYSGYVWEDNLKVAPATAVIITDVNVPENNAVAGPGAATDVTGTVTATSAQLSAVTAAVYEYDSLSVAELNSILDNTLDASSAKALAEKRAQLSAGTTGVESASFELTRFASRIRFDKLAGGKQYIYAVTATDRQGSSTTVYRAFYLSTGIETKTDHTVRLNDSGSVTEHTVSAGDSITLPERRRAGYSFLGWSADKSGAADYAPGSSFTPEKDCALYAVYKKIAAPAVPTVKETQIEAATDEIVTLQASAAGAESYTAYVYSADTLLRKQSFPTGKLTLAFEKAGTYTVKIEAFAGGSGSGQSSAVSVRVHGPVTVTFMNGDKIWAQQRVNYGSSASEPVAPARPGSSFTGWDGNLSGLREDTVLNAVFAEGACSVTFTDENGAVLSSQQVAYNGSAFEPEPPAKEGYEFLCWDTDAWRHVTEDGLTVSPVFIKMPDDNVLACALTEAKSVGSGRLVSYILTNVGTGILTGRAHLTGTSLAGNGSVEAEGSVFVLAPGESFSESVFLYADEETFWELTGTDILGTSTLGSSAILLGAGDGESRLWVSEDELKNISGPYNKIEESKQYGVSETESYTTPASAFLDWDKKSGGTAPVLSAWSAWQTEPVSAGDTVEVEERQVVTVPAHTEYRYGRWTGRGVTRTATEETHAFGVSPSLAYAKSVYKNASGTFEKQYSAWSTARFEAAETFASKLKDNDQTYYAEESGQYLWHIYYAGAPSENNAYFWEETRSVPAVSQTQYRYRILSEGEAMHIYSHKKEPAWTFSSAKDAGTRKVYCIRVNGAAGGDPVTLSGSLGSVAANKDAVFTLLADDGNGHENVYTEQIRLSGSGGYSVSVADMSALTVIDAPCVAYLNVAGATEPVRIGSFASGAGSCRVRFADGFSGELLYEQTVPFGGTAQAPEAQTHEGLLFKGWSITPAHLTGDTVITAEYEKETFSVIFSDNVAGTETVVSGVPFGSAVEAPEPVGAEGSTFMGWTVPAGGSLNEVTGPMRAEAVYAEAAHTVTYLSAPKGYDGDGNALTDTLAVISVPDGEIAPEPAITGDMHIPDTMYFAGWSRGAAEPVTGELVLVPTLGCVMDAETVTPSLPGGLYGEGEKLVLGVPEDKQLIVRYRFNTATEKGVWTEYDLKAAPEIALTASGELEIESIAPDKNTVRSSYSYAVASASALPAAPAIKSAKQTDTASVTVTWDAVNNVKGYILTRLSDCGEVCTQMLTGTSFTDKGLRPQRTYTYSVSAFALSEKGGSAFLLEGNASKALSVRYTGADKAVTKITVKGPTSMYTDSSVQLEATVSPSDAKESAVFWTVDSGGSYGTVSTDGVFRAISAGTVTVSAHATDLSGVTGTLKITVKEPETNAATVSVSSVSARVGETVLVNVSLAQGSSAGTVKFTVKYNSAKLTLKSAKKGELMSAASPTINTKTKGCVTFTYEGSALKDGGTLLALNFTVNKGATGSAAVQIATKDEGYAQEFLDGNKRLMNVAVKNGAVSIWSLLTGDVDSSGAVDITDAYLLRSFINGDVKLSDEQKLAADVNGDGKLNTKDIDLIHQYVVRLISTFPVDE